MAVTRPVAVLLAWQHLHDGDGIRATPGALSVWLGHEVYPATPEGDGGAQYERKREKG